MKYELEKLAKGQFRIHALKTFTCGEVTIQKGDLGGIVSGEDVLSQYDNSWIDEGATVLNSDVYDSYISKSTVLHSTIKKSSIVHSNILDSEIEYSKVTNSGVRITWVKSSTLQRIKVNSVQIIRSNLNMKVINGTGVLHSCQKSCTKWGTNPLVVNRTLHGITFSSVDEYIEFRNYNIPTQYTGYYIPTDNWYIGCFEGTTKELLKHLQSGKESPQQCAEYLQHVIQCRKLLYIKQHCKLPVWQSLLIELRTRLYK